MNVPDIANRLDRIETLLAELIHQKFQKEWYSTNDVAELTGRAEFTVREWCRLGRITAEKEANRRKREWRISHEEVHHIRLISGLSTNSWVTQPKTCAVAIGTLPRRETSRHHIRV